MKTFPARLGLVAQACLLSAAFTLAPTAHAKCKSLTSCFDKGTKEIGDTGKDVVDKAGDTGKEVVDKTGSAVTDAYKQASAAISPSEMNSLYKQAKTLYADTSGAVRSGYNQSVNALKAALNAALFALFNDAGKASMRKFNNQYKNMVDGMNHLDSDGQAALNRVVRAVTSKKLDEQTRSDMVLIATKLGVIAGGVNAPNNMSHSSFGIQVGDGAAAGVGVDETYGIIMNTYMENGHYPIGLTQSLGVSGGLQVGASANVGIYWGPGSMDAAGGPNVGINFELVGEVGGGANLSWGVPTTLLSAANAAAATIPGVSAGVGVGGEVKLGTLSAGYTQLIAKF